MKKLVAGVATLCLVAAFGASAEEQMMRVSMVISSGEKTLASPTLVIANGKRGTLTIGEKVVAAATSPALDKSVAIELTPTLQADGSVNMPIKLTFAEEKLVGQKPSTSTRQMMLELKVHPGNKASFVTPRADDVEPMGMSIQLDLLDDAQVAALRGPSAK